MERQAIIDVGSNSVLLLVAEPDSSGGHRTLAEFSRVTALGKDTKTTGVLGEAGMTATLVALAEAKQIALENGAELWLAGATMAARIAENTSEFIERAAAQGTPVQVVSGTDEAELGFRAIADDHLFADEPVVSIIDPGGHSTEIVTAKRDGHNWEILRRTSYPVGALGLRESVLHSESPNGLEVLRAIDYLDQLINLEYGPGEAGRIATLGATGVNLVSIRDGLTSYQPERIHGHVLIYEEISRGLNWMMGMTDQERAAIPGIEPGRERTLHIGLLILERFLYALRGEEVTVSTRGWRHALLDTLPDSLVKVRLSQL